jgi:hypothetical protein
MELERIQRVLGDVIVEMVKYENILDDQLHERELREGIRPVTLEDKYWEVSQVVDLLKEASIRIRLSKFTRF